jgi:hypothetical protein
VTDPTPATYQFTVDSTPPTVAPPAAPAIPVGEQLQLDGTLGVLESWSASDTYSPSSALLYTVEQRAVATPASLGSFAAIPTLECMQGTTAATVRIAPVARITSCVRAENQLSVAAETPHLRGDRIRSAIDGGSEMRRKLKKSRKEHERSGGFGPVDRRGHTRRSGTTEGRLAPVPLVTDARCTTVMLQSSAPVERRIVYVSGPLATNTTHTIAITTTSTLPVALDGFVVLG